MWLYCPLEYMKQNENVKLRAIVFGDMTRLRECDNLPLQFRETIQKGAVR